MAQPVAVIVERWVGEGILEHLDELAQLRIEVFREYPYLYDGTPGYERDYLRHYAACAEAVCVIVRRGDEVVGASTGLPLEAADEAFQAPFLEADEHPGDWFYFGESVLRPEFRGLGLGHRFFDEREAHAAALGFGKTCFCAVVRPDDHPRRPTHDRSHDGFWSKRGYRKRPDRVGELDWREVGQAGETSHSLVFWTREQALVAP